MYLKQVSVFLFLGWLFLIADDHAIRFDGINDYIIISDLQFKATSLLNFDSKEKVTIIPITDNNKSNIFIDSCWIKNYDYNSNFFEIFIMENIKYLSEKL